MHKSKYRTLARQERLSRVVARLLLSLVATGAAVLMKVSVVHAQAMAPANSAAMIESRVVADVSGDIDFFSTAIDSRPGPIDLPRRRDSND